ncbi:MAG TPA: ThuA domain-containing protein [Rhizomicrobium sp.]|jgi:type 1 glutamine amidotransferase
MENEASDGINRRVLVQSAGAVAGLLALSPSAAGAATAPAQGNGWEWEPMRWMQICATEDDPQRYDQAFWMDFLKRTSTQGVCLSAGGVTAFYPTKVPFHTRSPYLGKTDMFGDLTKACKKMGIRVLGRVDPHAMRADALAAHPEWVARNADGSPKKHPTAPDLFLTCPNGGITFDWMPKILKEIVSTYPVDGIFGNRWAGSAGICYCGVCRSEFKAASGFDVPSSLANPQAPEVKAYNVWVDGKRYAQLKLWTETVSAINQQTFFTPGTWGRLDPVRLRSTIRAVFSDRQGRNGQDPAWLNGRSAKEAYCTMQNRPVSGIFAVGETSTPYRFEDSTQANAEIATYLHDGLAHGFRPWMTKFKAEVFDKRWVPIIEEIYVWHARNEAYFRNTENLARVAMLQSDQTGTYYLPPAAQASGNRETVPEASQPRAGNGDYVRGYYQALVESRIPFNLADERQLEPEYVSRYNVLVLPNVAALSDKQCAQLRDYVEKGGAIVATHETSLCDEWGTRRSNFALADLFGCDYAGRTEQRVQNSYLTVRGPQPLTAGFDDAPRIMAGTKLVHVTSHNPVQAPLTLVPSYPDLPMERVFTTVRQTDTPMVYLRNVGKGRVVYFPFDLDRCFWETSNQDHLALLRNAVAWASGVEQPLTVKGPGMIDVSYWRQQNSLTAHLVNLTNPMAMKGYMREILPMGPFTVSMAIPTGASIKAVKLLGAGTPVESRQENGRLLVTIPRIHVHEVVAVDLA